MTELMFANHVLFAIFGIIILAGIFWAIGAFINDRFRSQSALRRSFPLVIRGRYMMEKAGVFLRQYMFAMDREELPFNRAQRQWVYKAAHNDIETVPFGSTNMMQDIFLPSMFPTLTEDSVKPQPYVIGEHTKNPYVPKHFFHISAMSFGSLSANAVEALAKGAGKAGCWFNTGEGGLSPYHKRGGGDLVVQIGTAKYGMRDEQGQLATHKLRSLATIEQVKMFELKLSQGAKPGKGGLLPGKKITAEIADLRGISEGKDSISPNRHVECHDVKSTLAFIKKIRQVTEKPCGVKMVVGSLAELEDFISQINKQDGPDFITVDGGEGGTGAAPASLVDYVGMPLFDALPVVVDMLEKYELKDSIEVVASGKLITPDQVAKALALGANFCVSARGFMFSLGCIQALHCNDNTCPTGITTQDERLAENLIIDYRAKNVENYINRMEYEVGLIAHSCGVKNPRALTREHLRTL